MRNLILVLSLFLASVPAHAAFDCKKFDRIKDYISPRRWFKKSQEFKAAKRGDPFVEFPNVETARNFVFKFPPLDRLGFGSVSRLRWKKVFGRVESSKLNGKPIGWEIKLEDGTWARVRLDYSPTDGAHYNIEVRVHSGPGKKSLETHNLSVRFPGNEADVLRMAEGH
jgi:hypothetical protein